ncbi:putative RNA-binding protein 5-like [Apostichopus japonicus]|uniref:Putative RNA-binding protein 5-like n=1 Tax=Stichopus japonicus TaxID=307972 RepID=A0A2G8LRM0_STIJA|nr:putative RNA-binding protein 5-like [Apostichopus japonicus]
MMRTAEIEGDGEEGEKDRMIRDDRHRHPPERPCRVIVLRQLPLTVDEDEIRAALQIFGAPVKDVRLVRHKESGVSRGFAFVEFQFLPDAQRWMDSNQGQLSMGGQRVTMNYSTSRDRDDDWFCSQCGTHNFKRRGYCFKCSIPKEESERFSEISRVPTRTLLLMGLDATTLEATVRKELLEITAVDMNIQIVRDPVTNASRGACYAVLATYEYSAQLLEILNNMNPPFMIDGKAVTVHYCRDNTDPMYANQQQWAGSSSYDYSSYYQQGQYSGSYDQQYYSQGEQRTGDSNDKVALAQEQVNAARRLQAQMSDNGGNSSKGRGRTKHDSISEDDNKNEERSEETGETSKSPESEAQQTSIPDTSQYQYDETSGYYYDPQTGLYYDASSQYYYNAESQKYLYWDANQQTFLPVPESASSNPDGTPNMMDSFENKEKRRKEEDKSKLAKKVAKDMARWAKSMNDTKLNHKKVNLFSPSSKEPFTDASADAGFAMLSKRADPEETKATVRQAMKDENESIVASYGGGSDSEEEPDTSPIDAPNHVQLTDWNKLICLLCKRQFPSKAVLNKHQQFSDLHKQNLEKLGLKAGYGDDDGSMEMKYRDRAKERRDKFGPSEPPPPKRRYQPPPVPTEEPTKFGIGEDNIGNKMLKNMGWKSGSGLGRQRQGRTGIIEVERRAEGAGLGMKGSRKRGTSDSYRVAVKQAAQQRFKEIQEAEQFN